MDTILWLLDLFLHIDRHLEPLVEACGGWTYLLLFAVIFLETGLVVTPFLPGDSLLFAAGAFAAMGWLSLPMLIAVLIVAAILGDTVNYSLGSAFGLRLMRWKRMRLIKPEHLAYTADFYHRYGGKTIVLARFVPIVRTLAPFVGGIGQMPYRRFMSYNVLGGIGWVTICTVAGYLFGNLPLVRENFSYVALAIVALSLTPVLWELSQRRGMHRQPVAVDPAAALESLELDLRS